MKWLIFLLALPTILTARNMENRLGLGLTVHNLGNLPCVSFRNHMSKYQSISGVFGLDTSDSNRLVIAGVKFYQNASLEENVNFFLGLGGFFEMDGRNSAPTMSGFEFQGLLGAEFYFSGLPNLGFSLETGVGIRTVRQVSLVTLGNGFLGSSAHYYF